MGNISWDVFATQVGGADEDNFTSETTLFGKKLTFESPDFHDAWEKYSGQGLGAGFRDNFKEALEAGVFDDTLKAINEIAKTGSPTIQGHTLDLASFDRADIFGVDDFNPLSFDIRDDLAGMKDVALLHYARNILLDTNVTFYDIVSSEDYKKIPDAMNAFHKTGSDNNDNTKWMDSSGTVEYIIRETDSGFAIVDDPTVYGTYNYGNKNTPSITSDPADTNGHLVLDVDPWVVFGNLPENSADMGSREAGFSTTFGAVWQTAKNLVNGDPNYNFPDIWTANTNTRYFGSADDTILPENNSEAYVFSGGGDDDIFSGPKADVFNGGLGTDTVYYTFSQSGVVVNLALQSGKMGDASDDYLYERLISIENVVGSYHSDILIGDSGNNKLSGSNGDDLLSGGHGNDTLIGGSGYNTAVYDGNISDYTVTQSEVDLGTWIVTGIDGTDTLTGIQVIQYADGKENLVAQNVEDSEFGDKLITSNAQAVIDYLFAADSGLSISSINYTGSLDALRLLPTPSVISNNAGSDISIGSGIFLTTGGMPGTQNTSSGFTVNLGTAGDTDLDETAQLAFSNSGTTNDAAVIEFTFTVVEGTSADTISFDIAFGSEEYPEYVDSSFVDIAAVYINGVNYALFNGQSNQPLSVVQNNLDVGNFIDNTSGQYGIEYDGFSSTLRIIAPIQAGENTVKIGIADTGDTALDSGLFVSNVQVGNSSGSGTFVPVIGTATDDNTVGDDSPEEFILGLGDDIVNPGGGLDVMYLGGGADTVEGTPDDLNGDIIADFTNEDTLIYKGVDFSLDQMTITYGSAIIDTDLDGDGAADTTIKLEGDFEFVEFNLETIDGNTVLTTSYIDQELFGTNGDDVLAGNVGNDTIIAGLGNNQLSGESGDDNLTTFSGMNTISGGLGSDFIIGGFQADHLIGDEGNDVIKGDASSFLAGSDIIDGGIGNDILMGGNGADTFVFETGNGIDTIAAFNTADVVFDAATGYSVTPYGSDFQSGIDHIQLAGFTSVDASNVMASVTDGADGAVFSAEGTSITFYGVDMAGITADDFIFA